MIRAPRLGGRDVQVLRSQLAMEVALSVYAVIGAVLVVRLALLALRVPESVWSGGTIYAATDPLVWPLTRLPGASSRVLGAGTLADVTALALIALVPVLLLARDRTR